MALVKFINPLAYLRGKLSKKDAVVYHHKNIANKDGEKVNYTSVYEAPAPRALSAREIATRDRFKAIAARVQAAYADSTKMATYRTQFAAQSAVKSLRKYVWDAEAALYDAE